MTTTDHTVTDLIESDARITTTLNRLTHVARQSASAVENECDPEAEMRDLTGVEDATRTALVNVLAASSLDRAQMIPEARRRRPNQTGITTRAAAVDVITESLITDHADYQGYRKQVRDAARAADRDRWAVEQADKALRLWAENEPRLERFEPVDYGSTLGMFGREYIGMVDGDDTTEARPLPDALRTTLAMVMDRLLSGRESSLNSALQMRVPDIEAFIEREVALKYLVRVIYPAVHGTREALRSGIRPEWVHEVE